MQLFAFWHQALLQFILQLRPDASSGLLRSKMQSSDGLYCGRSATISQHSTARGSTKLALSVSYARLAVVLMQIYVQLCCDLVNDSNNCDLIVMLQDLLTLQMAKSRRDLRFDDRVQVHRKGHPGRESQEPLAHELRCMPNTEQVQLCQVIKKRCHRYRPYKSYPARGDTLSCPCTPCYMCS